MVILILGLMAAIGAPRFSDHVRAVRLEAAARQFAAHIDYVRRVAINEGREADLSCSSTFYQSSNVDFPERLGERILVPMSDYDPAITLTADFDGQSRIVFDFEGVPHSGAAPLLAGSVTMTTGGDTFVIRVAAGTGRTNVTRLSLTEVTIDGSSGATP